MNRITRLTTMALSGLLVLLGFGGCRSSKKAAGAEDQDAQDSVTVTPPPSGPIRVLPDDPTRMRVLYGPPPAQYRRMQETK